MKNTITEMKNAVNGFKRSLGTAENRVVELEREQGKILMIKHRD